MLIIYTAVWCKYYNSVLNFNLLMTTEMFIKPLFMLVIVSFIVLTDSVNSGM